MNILLPTAYAGNLYYYALLCTAKGITIETCEHWRKQTYRNRCVIYGANGPLNLLIPIQHIKGQRQKIANINISYEEDWQRLHWRSLESAYRSSPYFEYYEHDLKPHYETKTETLLDFNAQLQNKIIALLQLPTPEIQYTTDYLKETELTDYRNALLPKTKPDMEFPEYIQVFGSKNGFIGNLSIFDLLFNEGSNGAAYLTSLTAL